VPGIVSEDQDTEVRGGFFLSRKFVKVARRELRRERKQEEEYAREEDANEEKEKNEGCEELQ